jgi:hypothetical protein
VAVEAGLTVSDCAELVEPVWPDPLDGVNAAVSDSGEPAAANDVEQVAVAEDPLPVNAWLVQPVMGVPLAENATVPEGAADVVETVAVNVTD